MNAFYPNTTQFPDELLDYWMAHVSHAEWKVLCYIVRHTYGFRKTTDSISFTQFADGMKRSDGSYVNHGCGIKSHATLSAALTELEKRGLVGRTISPKVKGVKTAATVYEFKPLARDQDNERLYLVNNEQEAFTERTPNADVTSSLSEPPAFTERTSSQFTERTPPSSLSELTTPTFTTPTQHPRSQHPPTQWDGAHVPTPLPLPDFADVLHDAEGKHEAGGASAVKPDTGNSPKAPRTPSKPSLQQADPEVYARREAIKARYFERYTAEPWDSLPASRQKYANADAERIARACASLDEALALMQAVYDERWSNGTYPNRAPFKLSACPGKLKAFRDGCLASRPSASSGGASARNTHSGMGRTDGWRAETFTIEDYCAVGLPGRTSCRMAMGHPHDTVMCGRTGLVEMGNGARVANPNVYNDEHITEFPHAS